MSKANRIKEIHAAESAAREQFELLQNDSISEYIKYQSSAPHWAYALSLSDETQDILRKVGDTDRGYIGISKRIIEDWGWRFPKAVVRTSFPLMLDDTHYVRDYYLHKVLRDVFGKHNLTREELLAWFNGNKDAYSQEVFECSTEDVLTAWSYILALWENGSIDWSQVYTIKKTEKPKKEAMWIEFRPLQQDMIDSYVAAVAAGRNHLLVYAAPRFGKCISTFGCAEASGARSMLITTAVASVNKEWRGTTENFLNFSDWHFVDAEMLKAAPELANKLLADGHKVAVFLTFQDIQGGELKEHHRDVINIDFDMNVRDETHIGARGAAFSAKMSGETSPADDFDDDTEMTAEREQADELNEYVNAHFKFTTQLDLSGTPYNIMMTDEFSPEDIIAQVSYSDILHAKEQWYIDNPDKPAWDNPYFDFPSMLTLGIALDPEASALYKEIARAGLGELTDVFDWYRDEEGVAHLRYPELVHRFFAALDGTIPDSGIWALLANEVVCQRIRNFQSFMILSRRVQVDLVVDYLNEHKSEFSRLSSWRFFKATSEDSYMSAEQIKEEVAACEREGISTMTFTVGKMMTGVTVPEWNLGINARPSDDPQFYDQSRSRGLSGYSEDVEFIAPDGTVTHGKRVLKEQMVFVDLVPNRALSIEADKAARRAMSTLGEDGFSPDAVADVIEYELSVMPHVFMDNITHVFRPVVPTDVLHAMTRYSEKKSIVDQVSFVKTVNKQWRENTLTSAFLEQMVTLNTAAQTKLLLDAYSVEDGDYSELDADFLAAGGLTGYAQEKNAQRQAEIDAAKAAAKDIDDDKERKAELARLKAKQKELDALKKATEAREKEYLKQQKEMIKYLCLYMWCAPYSITDCKSLIRSLSHKYNTRYKECERIAENMGLSRVLIEQIYKSARPEDKMELNQMCYRINALKEDDTLTDIEKVNTLFTNFSRLGESEIVTPMWVTDKMWGVISDEEIADAVASKRSLLCGLGEEIGEFSIAVYNRMKNMGYPHEDIARVIGCIPCSPIAYEMCLTTYRMLELDPRNIARHFDAYSLYGKLEADEKDGGFTRDYKKIAYALSVSESGHLCDVTLGEKQGEEEKKKMTINFKAVVGNPPYQDSKDDNNQDASIYDEFIDLCSELAENSVLITPARFLANQGATSKKWNEKMLKDEDFRVIEYYPNAKDVFPTVGFKGGVAITQHLKNGNFGAIEVFIPFSELRSIWDKVKEQENLSESNLGQWVYSPDSYRFEDIMFEEHSELMERTDKAHRKAVASNVFGRYPEVFFDEEPDDGDEYVRIIGLDNRKRTFKYVKKRYIRAHENLDKWKVIVPGANGSGALGEVLSTPLIGHSQTFISIGALDSEFEGKALFKYVNTKFARVLLGIRKITQNNQSSQTWSEIPLQDFTENSDIEWSKSISEIDQQLYEKYGLTDDEIAFIEKNVKSME